MVKKEALFIESLELIHDCTIYKCHLTSCSFIIQLIFLVLTKDTYNSTLIYYFNQRRLSHLYFVIKI